MSAAHRARTLTRWGAVGVMATAVLTATGGGFAQSFAGLYHWALEHGLTGWKAQSFPLLVDLFIIVGELGLFLLALDAFVLHRRNMMSWLDFFLPFFIALAGWTASLVFNVGHVVQRDFSYQATAAVPPIVSMLGLFVLLRTLHRYVQDQASHEAEDERTGGGAEGERRAVNPISLHQITLVPVHVMPQLPAGTTSTQPEGERPAAATATSVMTGTRSPEPARMATAASQAEASAPLGATLNGSGVNGHGGNVATAAAAPPDSTTATLDGIPVVDAGTEPDRDPETKRKAILSSLSRNNGDVVATQADLIEHGRYCGQDEISRVREQHWFPYAVHRLMAKHSGDTDRVVEDLAGRGITYDRPTFDALVRAGRP